MAKKKRKLLGGLQSAAIRTGAKALAKASPVAALDAAANKTAQANRASDSAALAGRLDTQKASIEAGRTQLPQYQEANRLADSTATTNARVQSVQQANDPQAPPQKVTAQNEANIAPGAKRDYSGYLTGRGISPDKIRAMRALNGQTNAEAPPQVSPETQKLADVAQGKMDVAEGYKSSADFAQSVKDKSQGSEYASDSTVALTADQINDPAYRLRVDSARQASGQHQARQAQLREIQQQVQNQRLAEAAMGRGRGIQNRADASRQRRDESVLTQGLSPEGRTGAILESRDSKMQARQADANRTYESGQADANRRSNEAIAQTEANAPAGNRGNTAETDRKARLENSRRMVAGVKIRIGELDRQIADFDGKEGGDAAFISERESLVRAQEAFAAGAPVVRGSAEAATADRDQLGLKPGEPYVWIDEQGIYHTRMVPFTQPTGE